MSHSTRGREIVSHTRIKWDGVCAQCLATGFDLRVDRRVVVVGVGGVSASTDAPRVDERVATMLTFYCIYEKQERVDVN